MFEPMVWAGIAEKLGIPFALLLLVFGMLYMALRWVANNVVKPLVESHVAVVNGIRTATQATADRQEDVLIQQQAQGVKLDGIRASIDFQTDELKKVILAKAT